MMQDAENIQKVRHFVPTFDYFSVVCKVAISSLQLALVKN
jgi:hypothetical protein